MMAEKTSGIEELLVELLDSHRALLKEMTLLRELVAGEIELKHKREDMERKRASAFLDSILPEDS